MSYRLVPFAAALIVIPAAILLLAGLGPAGSQSRTVRTQAVEITDGSGRVRITIDAYGNRPGIWLFDAAGARRLGVAISPQGVPEVTLIDPEGRPRLLLRVGAERAAELRVTDALGRPRIGLWVDYRDDPGIWLFDGLTRPRIGLKVSEGEPHLWLFDNPTGRVTFTAP